MKLNPKIIVLEKENDLVLLKIGSSQNIIKMSSIEFEIIKYYSEYSDFKSIQENFRNEFEIDKVEFNLLIKKAAANHILIDNLESKKTDFGINFILKKNKKIFEILNFDFSNTYLENFFENRFITSIIIYGFCIVFSYFIFYIMVEPLNFKENYLSTLFKVPISFSSIIIYIYLASFVSTLVHEFGHYFVYKRNYGKTSIFGFGLMFFFMPIFFNRIFVSLIKDKQKRIFINAGGILFDIFQFVFLIYFTKTYHSIYPVFSFFCYTLMFSISIRTFFNLNIFLPNTDGYFIFTELINKPNFFEIASQKAKQIFKKNEKIGSKNYLYALYILICYCFFAISGLMIFVPILSYFYYASFK